MRTQKITMVSTLLALGACQRTPEAPPTESAKPILFRFSGHADPKNGVLSFDTITPAGRLGSTKQGLVQDLPVEQDGMPGHHTTLDTVELVTEETGDSGSPLCGRDLAFCGLVTLRSFFPNHEIRGPLVTLTSMNPPTNNTAFGDWGDGYGQSSVLGLWFYDKLEEYVAPDPGQKQNSSQRIWKFDNYTGTDFQFWGVVRGELAALGAQSEDCQNGGDADGDGDSGCADIECATSPYCVTTEVSCGDGEDNDGDLDFDCDDADCASDPACVPPVGLQPGVWDDPGTKWDQALWQ